MEKKKLGYIIQIIFVLILLAIGIWRQNTRIYSAHQSAFLMDTLFEIEIEGHNHELEAVLDSAFILAKFYEEKLSYYEEGSLISKINLSKGEKLNIDEDLYELLKTGNYFYENTEGRYDLSIGLLSDLWDIYQGLVPSEEKIQSALNFTGFNRIEFNQNQIILPEGMKINLGSIAKGYVVDKLAEYFTNQEITSYLINAGGDLRIKGLGKTLIGIQHPRKDHGEIIDKIFIDDKAVVTSGDYERYFEKDGNRYHHLLDARTGYPAKECISVTAIADNTMLADALSTAVFLMPVEKGLRLVENIDNAWVIIYYINDFGEINRKISKGAEQFLE